MTLSTGLRLGPYEILTPLGAGGTGEVWKARDTRLERTVAIKGDRQYAVAPDGQRFLANVSAGSAEVFPATAVLDWAAALKAAPKP